MSNLAPRRAPAVVSWVDDLPAKQQWRDLPNGGLRARVPLSWTGVREYPQIQIPRDDGQGTRPARVLRRPEQVFAPAHLRTLERLPVTHDHPVEDGRNVQITPDNFRRYQCGQTGDAIERVDVNGYAVPSVDATVMDRDACAAIRAGDTQTSLGYTAMIAPPPDDEAQADGTGLWAGPHGPEPYDLEHVLDPEDPRVAEYADQEPRFNPADLGGNHLAAAIRRGRGGEQSELLSIVDSYDALSGPLRLEWMGNPVAKETDSPMAEKIIHCVDVAPPAKLAGKLPRFVCDMDPEVAAKVREYLGAAMSLLESMEAEKAEIEVKMDEAAGAAEAMGAEKQALTEQVAAQADELAAVKSECDSLRTEVLPLRAAALAAAKQHAIKLGADSAVVEACDSIDSVRLAWANAKLPSVAALGTAAIAGAWTYAIDSLNSDPGSDDVREVVTPSAGFQAAARATNDGARETPKHDLDRALDRINGVN